MYTPPNAVIKSILQFKLFLTYIWHIPRAKRTINTGLELCDYTVSLSSSLLKFPFIECHAIVIH